MKNNKGFTLIEIIAAVIILGIISITALITYTNSMQEFRENYYDSLTRSIMESGQEFFEDNRNYKPTSVFSAQKVPIALLESKSYIEDIKDYNGKSCDRSSYVIAIKAGKNNYIYHTCLVCSEDTYTNMADKYCDPSWDDPSTVRYTLGELRDAYIYKNTSQEKLREKLLLSISIAKYDNYGNKLDEVSGDGIDEVPQILPENIDIIDTTVAPKTYEVTYKYNKESSTRKVHIYENSKPDVTLEKTNTYALRIVRDNVEPITRTTSYLTDDWAQEINFTFGAGTSNYITTGIKVAQYQWNKGGRWDTICNDIRADGSCVASFRQEMNEEIQFRTIDTEGNISKVTTPVQLRIDRTAPKCTLKKTGTLGLENWYVTNVEVAFEEARDQTSNLPEAMSDLWFKSIRRGATVYNQTPRTSNVKLDHTDDSQYVTYYGFVEDKAQNYAKCDITLRKDATPPTCTITGHATLRCVDETSKLVKVYFGQTDDSDAGTSLNKLEEWTDTKTVTVKGRWYLKATDEAGLSSQMSSMYYLIKYDKNGGDTEPTVKEIVKRETEHPDLTQVTRKGKYKMIGWNTNKNATIALSDYVVSKDETLYAIYVLCENGEYTNTSGNACSKCPAGYRDGGPAANINGCEKIVPAGHYVQKANDASPTECGTGDWKEEHTVKYGETSTCHRCPSGYQEGTLLVNKTAENKCLRNMPAGYYMKDAKSTTNTDCPTGYYKTNHTVTYGATTSCDLCPSGYQDGTAHENKIAENKCLRNMPAGYYMKDSRSTVNTDCGKGYYKTGHSITYGQTSSCDLCPAGYRDGTAHENKVAQNKCLKIVDAGNYVQNARDEGATECTNGYYKVGHNVTYGSTSECVLCPTGYQDGTLLAHKTSESACLKKVSAGYYIKNAKDASATVCGNGTYKIAHSVTFGSTSTCNTCPDGYKDGTQLANKVSEDKCLKNVDAGYYIKTTKDATPTECATGNWKEAHSLTYGQTSTCHNCPTGYQEGTLLANKVAENKCLKNVSAGYYIKKENDATATECAGGKYKTAHSVTYGSTSSCIDCPAGYGDGTLLANKVAENKCLKNVTEGHYIKTAKDANGTECGKGTYNTVHSVTYGDTSVCTDCPAGYQDGTLLENKVSQDKCLMNVAAGNYVKRARNSVATECGTGKYKTAHTVTYGNTSSCSDCPTGYTDGNTLEYKTAQNKCMKIVAAGYYLKNTYDESGTECANGKYKTQHNVTYGQTSSCIDCPTGYRDGTTIANKVAENKCLKTIEAGYYLKETNDPNATVCGTGTYRGSHTVTYGSVSACYDCPRGYRDGTGIANKISAEKCLKNVPAGYYLKTEYDSNATMCANGNWKEAQSLTYGQTSTCNLCPDGYRDGSAVENKISQEKCLKSVDAGYYVKKANDVSATVCANGNWKEKHSVTYGNSSTCNTCPGGYQDGTELTNKTAENKCLKKVSAGYYVNTTGDSAATICADGTYREAHDVLYGSISACINCPKGYRNGSLLDNKKSINKCLKNVEAGYYVETAGSAGGGTVKVCADGKWKGAHSVTYDQTSSCNDCPDGYKDGNTLEYKTAENKCLKSVSAGYKVATSKGAATECEDGKYKTAHPVTYGQTSSCTDCPSGYRDGTFILYKTAENKCLKNVQCGYKVATSQGAATKCEASTYSSQTLVTYGNTSSCTVADNGSYAPEGACSQTVCPSGYRDGTQAANKVSEASCARNVECGYEVKTVRGTPTKCSAGTYSTQHVVTYGGTSACTVATDGYYALEGSCSQTICPEGYRNGKFIENKINQSQCIKSVPAGKYVKESLDVNVTSCTGLTYSYDHNVKYGNTSTCFNVDVGYYPTANRDDEVQCPRGYREAAVENQAACYRTVPASYYVKNGGDENNTACATGYDSTSHVVKYGATSMCVPNKYTVKYDKNGSTGTNQTQTVTYNASWTTKDALFTKSGYVQSKWKSTENVEYSLNTNQGAYKRTSDLTLNPVFEPRKYTVTYKPNGGTGSDQTQEVTFDANWTTKGLIFNDNKPGYKQIGWSTSSVGSTTHNANTAQGKYTTVGDTTLYATWQAKNYTVTYKANGGTGSDVTQSVTYDQAWTTKNGDIFSKTGHTLLGWSTSTTGGVTHNLNTSQGKYQTAGNTTLNAVWSAKNYTVTYRPGSATGNNQTQTVTYGNAWTTKDKQYSKTGYTQTSWKNGSTTYNLNTNQGNYSIEGDLTLDAVFTANKYTVTYKPNGGVDSSGNSNDVTQTVTYDSNWTTKPASIFTRKGYGFDTWVRGPSDEYTPNTNQGTWTNTSDITLNARWYAKDYTIYYNGNGGTLPGLSTDQIDQRFLYDTNVTIDTCHFTKRGYSFVGWTTNSDGTDDGYNWTGWSGTWNYDNGEYGIQNRVLNLYARWQLNTYTVSYDKNGATGSDISSHTVQYGSNITIKSNPYTTTGYTGFWTTHSSGANDGYNWTGWSGTWLFIDGEYGISGTNLKLYNGWKANKYTVTYDKNGGSGDNQSQTVTYNSDWTTKGAIFTRTDYQQVGWVDTNGTEYSLNTNQGTWTRTGNLTLKAKWKIICAEGYSLQSDGTCLKTYTATCSCPEGYTRSGLTCSYTGSSGKVCEGWMDGDNCYKYDWEEPGVTYKFDKDGGHFNANATSTQWYLDEGVTYHMHYRCGDTLYWIGNNSDPNYPDSYTERICNADWVGCYYKAVTCGWSKSDAHTCGGSWRCAAYTEDECDRTPMNVEGYGYHVWTCAAHPNACSSGYSPSSDYPGWCNKTVTGSYVCPEGYTESNGVCYRTWTEDASCSCNQGDSRDGETCTSVYTPS